MIRPVTRNYSIKEAIAFTVTVAAYCDRVRADYPDADLGSLESYAAAFRLFLETAPEDLLHLRAIIAALRQAKEIEGTDWLSLLSYIEEYAEHMEQPAAAS